MSHIAVRDQRDSEDRVPLPMPEPMHVPVPMVVHHDESSTAGCLTVPPTTAHREGDSEGHVFVSTTAQRGESDRDEFPSLSQALLLHRSNGITNGPSRAEEEPPREDPIEGPWTHLPNISTSVPPVSPVPPFEEEEEEEGSQREETTDTIEHDHRMQWIESQVQHNSLLQSAAISLTLGPPLHQIRPILRALDSLGNNCFDSSKGNAECKCPRFSFFLTVNTFACFLLPLSSFLLPPSSFLFPLSLFLFPSSSFLLPLSLFLLPLAEKARCRLRNLTRRLLPCAFRCAQRCGEKKVGTPPFVPRIFQFHLPLIHTIVIYFSSSSDDARVLYQVR
mmetsp:Transcript_15687/g.39876  ORF Transcript_15687/g.39876 Transcript_15687/m.39876 type:complete len:334 (-) Transcript_15687:424-1425(-)